MIDADARGSWTELERRLRPYVARRLACDSDVDDVVQEVFVRIHCGLGGLKDGDRFGPWVYRIASNAVTDHLRARTRNRVTANAVASLSLEAVDPGARLDRDLKVCIAYFVSQLPSPYREALVLTELEGLTQREAAKMVGISVSGMKSRVQRGRQRIRDMFEACCEIALDGRGKIIACETKDAADIPSDLRAAALLWANRRV